MTGMIPASPYEPVAISDDYGHYPMHVAKAVAPLRTTGIGGPYAIALGSRCYTGVIETTEHGGYPVFEHLHQILEGPVVWAPAVDGAVVLSQRGGDFELTVGQDFCARLPLRRRRFGQPLHRGERDVSGQHPRGRRAPRPRVSAQTGQGPDNWPSVQTAVRAPLARRSSTSADESVARAPPPGVPADTRDG